MFSLPPDIGAVRRKLQRAPAGPTIAIMGRRAPKKAAEMNPSGFE
jgi:hypothetical protein